MIVNGYKLNVISAHEARKLPEGTVLIVERLSRDFKTYEIKERHYFRVRTQYRKTVAGQDVAIRSEPDSEWPEIPLWQLQWIWLEMSGFMNIVTIEGKVEA